MMSEDEEAGGNDALLKKASNLKKKAKKMKKKGKVREFSGIF